MQLPVAVRQHIEEQADALGFPALQRAAAALSDAYREGRAPRLSAVDRTAAYLATRMPATYAAAHSVLREVAPRIEAIGSVLDAGAGTGAASLAASAHFPEARITLVERDSAFAGAARQWLPDATLIASDIVHIDIPTHDLIIAAYSLGEFGARLAARLWQAARVALVLVEPGTPRGFALIRQVRSDLLAAGARMIAPCPAETPCPIADPDWCH